MSCLSSFSDWETIVSLLPFGWEAAARTTGAFQKPRRIESPEHLLRLLFHHVSTGSSYAQTTAQAALTDYCHLSAPALQKRLVKSRQWLATLLQEMIRSKRSPENLLPPSLRLRIADATDISRPGAKGTTWKIHYSLALPDLECDFLEIAPMGKGHPGENFTRFEPRPGDLMTGDRIYASRRACAHVLEAKAHILVRWHSSNFPLVTPEGEQMKVLEQLRGLREPGQMAEWQAGFVSGGVLYPVRLCAVRLDEKAAAHRQKELRSAASRQGRKLQKQTLEMSHYLVVVTSVGREDLAFEKVLELYRFRWQVELAFKRLKSLLELGKVPNLREESGEAWLLTKLLMAVLLERLQSRAFPPSGGQDWSEPLDGDEAGECGVCGDGDADAGCGAAA